MQKLPIGRYFGAMILLWGVTTTTTVAVTNFTTLCVNRVFLGVFETCSSPILTILVSTYWSRDEQPLRASIWWCGSAVGGFIADSITYGVSSESLAGSRFATWQVIIWAHTGFFLRKTSNRSLTSYRESGDLPCLWAHHDSLGDLNSARRPSVAYDCLVFDRAREERRRSPCRQQDFLVMMIIVRLMTYEGHEESDYDREQAI